MHLREQHIVELGKDTYDALIIGGGINGAVTAAALSAKGAKVALIEREDFACGASSNSSNFAWGGIKYLESHEYLLVNKLCKSRNHLLRRYPSRVAEIRFLTTIDRHFRFHPASVFLGTMLYWMMGRFFTAMPKYYTAKKLPQIEPTINSKDVVGGIEYSDCYFYDNDARFVYNFIHSSMENGCIVANYVASLGSERLSNSWLTRARNEISGHTFTIKSRVLINACGPYVDTHNKLTKQATRHHHLFSKGVHLTVDKITDNKKVLTFFADDGRMFFIVPMGPKTCIGTTDTQVSSPKTQATVEDIQFILTNANRLLKLKKPLRHKDVIAVRCGVRPLAVEGKNECADWVKLSRKHAIDIDYKNKHLSIFGGKLTDCINVGDEVSSMVARLGVHLRHPQKTWAGEPEAAIRKEFFQQAALMKLDTLTPATSSEPLSKRLWRRYGDKAIQLLEVIRKDLSQAELLIAGTEYLRCEIELAARHEMIIKLEDFLRRRSKIAMVVRHEDIIKAAGLKTACKILFGEQADFKLQEYIDHKRD